MNKYYIIQLSTINEHNCHFKQWSFKQRKDAEAFFFNIISDLTKEYNVSCVCNTPHNKEWNMVTHLDDVYIQLDLCIKEYYIKDKAIEEYNKQKKEILFK